MAHPSVVINSVQYQAVPQVEIPKVGSGTAVFYDSTDCTVAPTDVRSGKVFVGASGEDTGTLADNGAVGGEIDTKAGTISIPAGITSGGTVSLKASAISDLVSGNLLKNKTVLGVTGSLEMVSVSQNSTTKVLSIS